MSLPIFFHQHLQNDFITLSEETSKHVVQVLRMDVDEQLQLTDGAGNLLTVAIADAHKKKCSVKVLETSFTPRKEKQVSVAISLLKNTSRFEWFLEKATELGVTEILPFISNRTEKQKFRSDRMHQIVVAAMIQSQQVWLPALQEPVDLKDVIERSVYADKLVAHCEDDAKLQLRDFYSSSSLQVLIGPEGDFTKEEIAMALGNGYKPVTLGTTRLRAETAGIAAAALLCV